MGKNGEAMKFGLLITFDLPDGADERQRYQENLELVKLAEDLGYDSVWFTEHHFTGFGGPSAVPVVLGAVAALTSRIRIGTSITILPLHHAVEVAEQFATIDLLSGGRLDWGVGRGYQAVEFLRYGVPLEDTRDRLNEGVDLVIKAWTQDSFTYDGKYYKIDIPTTLRPRPVQKPHPRVWQVAVSPATVKKLAESGFISPIFSGGIPLEELKSNYYEPWVRAVTESGRQVSDYEPRFNQIVYVGETMAKAREEGQALMLWARQLGRLIREGMEVIPASYGKFWEEFSDFMLNVSYEDFTENNIWVGDPDYICKKIELWKKELNIRYLILSVRPGGLETPEVRKSMELFAKYVAPAFQ